MSEFLLGINSAYHESSACLIHEGRIVAAVEEERFNRVKHAKSAGVGNAHLLPWQAIRYFIEQAGISRADISQIGYSFDPVIRWQQNQDLPDTAMADPGDFGSAEGEETFYRSNLEAMRLLKERIAAAGAGLVIYLLLKPIDTGEDEAIADVLTSGRYLQQLSQRLDLPLRIALEPTFVPLATPLHQALLEGRYTPPSLWSVVEVVRELGALMPLHVGLYTEGLPIDNIPRGCDLCTGAIREALEQFKCTQSLPPLAELRCRCQNQDHRTTEQEVFHE